MNDSSKNIKKDNDENKTLLQSKAYKINLLLFSIIKDEIIKRNRFINNNISISKSDKNKKKDNEIKIKKIDIEQNKNEIINCVNSYSDDSEEDSSNMSCDEEIII